MREWYLILIGCCKATTGCNQGSSGGSTTQQSAPIRVSSLGNGDARIFHWQLNLYHLFIYYSVMESTYFWHILLGFHLIILNHNNSRIQPLERALCSDKTCGLVHLFQCVLMLPPHRGVLEYQRLNSYVPLRAAKTLLCYRLNSDF